MREVIEKMLEIEQQARRIVAKAEAEATKLTDEARVEARRTVEEARQRALAQVDGIIREAAAEAEKRKAAELTRIREQFEAEKGRYEGRIPEVAERLVPLLLGGEPKPAPQPTASLTPEADPSVGEPPEGS